jgi:predicted TIM-barrel fold metal-dependent hydrolase
MDWVSDLADVRAKHGVTNVYAELGTSFASSVVTHPRHCAAMLGILLKGLGADHVLWGTDSVWYGSPQWQIEAFRRIEIPEEMQKRYGFPALGPADGATKRAILGENAARLYASIWICRARRRRHRDDAPRLPGGRPIAEPARIRPRPEGKLRWWTAR